MATREAILRACVKYDAMGLDVNSVVAKVLNLDAESVKCGKGWEGTKPGCTRAKKGGVKTENKAEQFKLKSPEELKALAPDAKKKYFEAMRDWTQSPAFKEEQAKGAADYKAFSAKARAAERGKVKSSKTTPPATINTQALFEQNSQLLKASADAKAKVAAKYNPLVKESAKKLGQLVNSKLSADLIGLSGADKIEAIRAIHKSDPEVKKAAAKHQALEKEWMQKQREAAKPFDRKIAINMHKIADITGDESYRSGYKLPK